MTRIALALIAGLLVGGCSTSPLAVATGGGFSAFTFTHGRGDIVQGTDGRLHFTWAIQATAHDGLNEASRETGRIASLGRWLAHNGYCGHGSVLYLRSVAELTMAPVIVYRGYCK